MSVIVGKKKLTNYQRCMRAMLKGKKGSKSAFRVAARSCATGARKRKRKGKR